MQQRLQGAALVEVAGLLPEGDVGYEARAGGDVLAQPGIFVGQQKIPTRHPGGAQYQKEGRKNPLDASRVELRETEIAVLEAAQENAGDEVPGNDEEYVHPDEPAGEQAAEGVKSQDRQDGDRAKSIDVGTMLCVGGSL